MRARFSLRFLLIAAALFAIYCFPYAENGISVRFFEKYLEAYARFAGSLISVFEPGLTVTRNLIAGRYAVRIVMNCDAMEVNILFCAAVLAFPARWHRRVVAMAAGLFVLVALNVIRISSLYFIGLYLPGAFGFLHLEIWPLVMIAAASGTFLACASWLRAGAPELGALAAT